MRNQLKEIHEEIMGYEEHIKSKFTPKKIKDEMEQIIRELNYKRDLIKKNLKKDLTI